MEVVMVDLVIDILVGVTTGMFVGCIMFMVYEVWKAEL